MPQMVSSDLSGANTIDDPASFEFAGACAVPSAGEVPLCRLATVCRSNQPTIVCEGQTGAGSSDMECHILRSDAPIFTPLSSFECLSSIHDQHFHEHEVEQNVGPARAANARFGKWALSSPTGLGGFSSGAQAAALRYSVRNSVDHATPMDSSPQFLSAFDSPLRSTRAVVIAETYGVNGVADPTLFAMKLLLSCHEAGCIIGDRGLQIKHIQQSTGAQMHLSGRNDFYPQTSLQELNIQGPTSTAVVNALRCTLEAVIRQCGVISAGESNVRIGKACLNTVVPNTVARALVGRGGVAENLWSIKGVWLQIIIQQQTDASRLQEMVVRLSGTLEGVNAAIIMIAEHLSCSVGEPWFPAWACHSRCTASVPGYHVTSPDAVDRTDLFVCHKPQDPAWQLQHPQHAQQSRNSKPAKRAPRVHHFQLPQHDCDPHQLAALVHNVAFIQHSHRQMQQVAQCSSKCSAKLAVDASLGEVMSV